MDFVAKHRKKKKEKSRTENKQNTASRIPGIELPDGTKDGVKCFQSAGRLLKRRVRTNPTPTEELNERDTSTGKSNVVNVCRISAPVPLPLPSPDGTTALKSLGSFRSGYASIAVSVPSPLPLPPLGKVELQNLSFSELTSACQNFSVEQRLSECISHTVYKAAFSDNTQGSKRTEATVNRLRPSSQGYKEFVNEVTLLASLQHPNLCRLLGFHAQEGSNERLVVYERLPYGSLDQLLLGRLDCPTIDWVGRMRVALCAAKGLAFLHEEGPCQAMYQEFSAASVQVDKDFTAKLSGYGCVNHNPKTDFLSCPTATAYLSPETLVKGLLTQKSNVYSFGIMLLEVLTGRKNMDHRYPSEERNVVKWSRPFLSDDCRLLLILDPRVKGRCPVKAARTVADIALKCLQNDPSQRPTMRDILKALKGVQDMKHPNCHPLQEPSAVTSKQLVRLPSLTGITLPFNTMNFSSPLSPIISPTSIPLQTN